jgi:hypothetical protein
MKFIFNLFFFQLPLSVDVLSKSITIIFDVNDNGNSAARIDINGLQRQVVLGKTISEENTNTHTGGE